jgi:Cu/Zn superoxide dismutase
VNITNAEGQAVGTATLSPAASGVKIVLDIKKLPPGDHSIHIHQMAKSDPPDIKSAGPHFSPAGHMHDAAPAGDIPDFALIVGKDGTAHVSTVAPNVTMGDDDRSVFSNGGTAIVIHAVAGGTDSAAPHRLRRHQQAPVRPQSRLIQTPNARVYLYSGKAGRIPAPVSP